MFILHIKQTYSTMRFFELEKKKEKNFCPFGLCFLIKGLFNFYLAGWFFVLLLFWGWGWGQGFSVLLSLLTSDFEI